MPRARRIAVALTLLASAILVCWFTTAPAGSPTLRQFDPNRMAELELQMWQAYYGKERIRLFALLVTLQQSLRAGFNPRTLARAELAWWVARRTPGENSPDHVGVLMAEAYALMYEAPRAQVMRAALLRAEAAALRDAEAHQPDWDAIGRLLRESYRDLRLELARDRTG